MIIIRNKPNNIRNQILFAIIGFAGLVPKPNSER